MEARFGDEIFETNPFKPISGQFPHFIPHENTRKPVFLTGNDNKPVNRGAMAYVTGAFINNK